VLNNYDAIFLLNVNEGELKNSMGIQAASIWDFLKNN